VVEISWRCQQRLHHKYRHLELGRGHLDTALRGARRLCHAPGACISGRSPSAGAGHRGPSGHCYPDVDVDGSRRALQRPATELPVASVGPFFSADPSLRRIVAVQQPSPDGPLAAAAVLSAVVSLTTGCGSTVSPASNPLVSNTPLSALSGSGGGGGGASATSAPPCSSITAAEVGAAVGYSVSAPTSSGNSGDETCLSQPASQPAPVTVVFQVTSLGVVEGAETSANGVTKLSGIDEAAYSVASVDVGNNENEVIAYDKGVEVTVGAVASVDQITSLVNRIFSQL